MLLDSNGVRLSPRMSNGTFWLRLLEMGKFMHQSHTRMEWEMSTASYCQWNQRTTLASLQIEDTLISSHTAGARKKSSSKINVKFEIKFNNTNGGRIFHGQKRRSDVEIHDKIKYGLHSGTHDTRWILTIPFNGKQATRTEIEKDRDRQIQREEIERFGSRPSTDIGMKVRSKEAAMLINKKTWASNGYFG